MKRKAFLVGCNSNGLEYCEAAAELMQNALSYHDYEITHITQPNQKSSADEFIKQLRTFVQTCSEQDTMLFFFAGHSWFEKGHFNLALANDVNDPEHQLPVDFLLPFLKRCDAQDKLLIFDCCRASKAAESSQWWSEQAQGDWCRIFTATNNRETALETDQGKCTLFTSWIYRALTSEASSLADENGYLRISHIDNYVRQSARNYKEAEQRSIPIPGLHGFTDEDIVVAQIDVQIPPKAIAPTTFPKPQFKNERIRTLSEALENAYQQEENLLLEGQDTTQIKQDILELRRQLRMGGQLKEGDFLLAGRYRLIERLGHGGFATIWKAFDRKNREPVAIKVLHGQYADDRSRCERFFRGARQMASLQHQGIVRVLEQELEDEGFRFFVMEYLAGGDFRQAVLNNTLSLEARLAVILNVAEALQFAHENNVIHRDVKPANIVLDEKNRAKLTDFDLVRAFNTTGGTRTGMMGTFIYAAPELMDRPQEAGVPADVYGLAMTMAFALHGQDLPTIVLRDAHGFIDRLDVSDSVKSILQQAVDWDSHKRQQSVDELYRALRDIQEFQLPATAVKEPEPAAIEEPESTPVFIEGLHDKLKDGTEGPAMVWLVGGKFRMGDDKSSYSHEKPAHEVELTAFSIGQFPVTVAEYTAFCSFTGRELPIGLQSIATNCPVTAVNYSDATAYCQWLSQQTGEHYSLLSEAQWEYACRSGTNILHCSGDDEASLSDHAWYFENSSGHIQPVGQKRPNRWQLFDMHGNVWEWVQDWFSEDYLPHNSSVNPSGPLTGSGRITRGGCWFNDAEDCSSTSRFIPHPNARCNFLGFRLLRTGPWRSYPITLLSNYPSPPKQEPYSRIQDTLQNGESTPKTIYLPGGKFIMGSDRYNSEKPKHPVTVDAFAIGIHPVTVGEFRQFVEITGYQTEAELEDSIGWKNPFINQSDDHPVVCVNWDDAKAYCDWLSEQTGEIYELPTEAQWEYACRAGSNMDYCFGNSAEQLTDYAWYSRNSEITTHPVGEKQANSWGLYDMHGHVWEWVQDWYAYYIEQLHGATPVNIVETTNEHGELMQLPLQNPSGPSGGSNRVIRGGSWIDDAGNCRSASRRSLVYTARDNYLGFRISKKV